MEEDLFKLPVNQSMIKEITIFGLPFNFAIFVGGILVMGLAVFRSAMIVVLSLIIYIVLVILIKLYPKFDPKILEIMGRMSFKKYINH